MGRLEMYLPPFSGDYSGACSAVYDLGGMVCIHDAAGCTGNYTLFDEPRWYGGKSFVYCTAFRKIDAILGNDEKVINKIVSAASELKPRFICIVGSPVPNVIGFDFKGVTKDIEHRTGIPSIGIATSGIDGSYKTGIVDMTKLIWERFVLEEVETEKDVVNILGVSPLDISYEIYSKFVKNLSELGFSLNGIDLNDLTYSSFEGVKNLKKAELNLAISDAGEKLAIDVYEKYGIPYVVGLPSCIDYKLYKELCDKAIKTGEPQYLYENDGGDKGKEKSRDKKAIIIYDAVIGKSIANKLYNEGFDTKVYSFFASDNDEGVTVLHDEDELLNVYKNEDYDLLVADSFLTSLPRKETEVLYAPHYAISSKLSDDSVETVFKKYGYV